MERDPETTDRVYEPITKIEFLNQLELDNGENRDRDRARMHAILARIEENSGYDRRAYLAEASQPQRESRQIIEEALNAASAAPAANQEAGGKKAKGRTPKEPQPKTQPEPRPEAKGKTAKEPQPETQPEPRPEAKGKTAKEPQPETEPEPEPQPETEPEPQPETEPEPQPEEKVLAVPSRDASHCFTHHVRGRGSEADQMVNALADLMASEADLLYGDLVVFEPAEEFQNGGVTVFDGAALVDLEDDGSLPQRFRVIQKKEPSPGLPPAYWHWGQDPATGQLSVPHSRVWFDHRHCAKDAVKNISIDQDVYPGAVHTSVCEWSEVYHIIYYTGKEEPLTKTQAEQLKKKFAVELRRRLLLPFEARTGLCTGGKRERKKLFLRAEQ